MLFAKQPTMNNEERKQKGKRISMWSTNTNEWERQKEHIKKREEKLWRCRLITRRDEEEKEEVLVPAASLTSGTSSCTFACQRKQIQG